ncbi:hypothetical protein FHR81_000259 [Actinoalloteichus hoggarensis]|uniref:Uncharacterized protein n=1 Tax=Actinoalloteichus hoggarensis TaxID=1470176 RepID=A0A221W2X6_9PSEU|nr:hypothetical protein [Actinoalloteichus hoggarensis]ASO20059.1 hypothetical protein AHOG_12080 [Actinoalloteichus hoggarensis]MBB5919230.1 hypothetical protein [Actinoalloteichus hoggarensis]
MNSVRRAFVSTVLAGALALGGGAVASAAPAAAAVPDGGTSVSAASVAGEVTAAHEFYYGYGFGSTESLALFQAQEQAYNQAWIFGGWQRWQCSVTSSFVTPVGLSYNAQVTLWCF